MRAPRSGIEHREGTPSSYEVLIGEIPLQAALQRSPHSERLFCVPATIDLAGAEIELVSMVAREGRLRTALAELKDYDFDYVFIDCPPSLGLLTINALVAAPEVLIPIQCEYYALEGVGQLLRNIEMVKAHLNPELNVSTVILTMYDGRTRLADQVADDVRAHFGDKVLRTVIPRSVKVSEAPGYGMTILDYDPGSRGAMSYLDASREIAERGQAGPVGHRVSVRRSGKRPVSRSRGGAQMTQPTRKRSGLGRGLASLIPTGPADADSRRAADTRMGAAAADVVIGGAPARRDASDGRGGVSRDRPVGHRPQPAAAAAGLRRGGARRTRALHPRVRPHAADRGARDAAARPTPRYQLVMGERRWRAAQEAGLATIPAIVRETADDSMLRDALLENIHRAQLNPLEEAAAYQQLLDEFGVTHDELAARIGRSRPLITNMIRLLRLPIAVQRRVAAGVLSAGHARALLSLEGGPERRRSSRRASSPRGCRSVRPRRRSRWRTARTPRPRRPRAASRSRCPVCRTLLSGCRRPSIPASRSVSANARARSSSSSGRSTTSSASST